MAIIDFKNIENINLNLDSTAQLVASKDLNIFKTSAKNITDFGMSKNDVIEFRLYDLSNNLLEQTEGKRVRYITKQQLPKYLKSDIDPTTQEKIFDIDIEKLVKEAGYGNGEFKVVFNFLKNYLGSQNTKQRVWIHEVSPSRTEIRIQPLITTDETQNAKIKHRYEAFSQNTSELRENRDLLLKYIDGVELTISDYIDEWFKAVHGVKWIEVIRKDFKFLNDRQYTEFKQKIFTDFKKSFFYQIDGKEFRLGNPNYGQDAANPMDIDEFVLTSEVMNMIDNRLNDSVTYNMENVRFREFPIQIQELLKTKTDSQALQSLLDTAYSPVSNLRNNNTLGDITQNSVVIDTTPKPPVKVEPVPPVEIKVEPQPTPEVPLPAPVSYTQVGGGGLNGASLNAYTRGMGNSNYIQFNYYSPIISFN